MLLDDDHGDVAHQRLQPLGDLLDDADPHALGRLVQQQQLRLAIKARQIASILRSPPESVPAAAFSRWPSLGNRSPAPVDAAVAFCRCADLRFSRTVSCRRPHVLRHIADAARTRRSVGSVERVVPSNSTLPRWRELADHGLEQVVLPTPLRPRTATCRGAGRQIDVEQHLAAAVAARAICHLAGTACVIHG